MAKGIDVDGSFTREVSRAAGRAADPWLYESFSGYCDLGMAMPQCGAILHAEDI